MKNDAYEIIAGSLAESKQFRKFIDGSARSSLMLQSCEIGFGTYKPGWQWSTHAGAQTGKPSQNHIGYIISGYMLIKDSNGIEKEIGPGEAFEVAPGHDAWVIGTEPCVALDFYHKDP